MRGSIRVITGLIIVFGSVGGMDNATDGDLLLGTVLAVAGLFIMYSGVTAMNRGINE
jgi:hypothetical protein